MEKWVVKHPKLLKVARKARDFFPHTKLRLISFSDEFVFATDWARRIPNEFDIIIGIPRNGLTVANIIATKLGRPLSTPENFKRGEIWNSHDSKIPEKIKKVLLVEDSIGLGRMLTEAHKELHELFPKLEIKTASLFITLNAQNIVDFYYCRMDGPVLFEWNLLTSGRNYFGKLAIDMDGILCKDCPLEFSESDNADYKSWLDSALPYLIPSFNIDAIVTARLEKYRGQTEAWLKRYGIKYDKLIMLNIKEDEQRTQPKVIAYKIAELKKINPTWYWESSANLAIAIHKKSKLPVLCVEKMFIYS